MAGSKKNEFIGGEEFCGVSPREMGTGEGALSFLALAEDWLTAQDALLYHRDEAREAEIEELRRQWDHGTLVVDAEALADRFLR